jgi:hypothetical protein
MRRPGQWGRGSGRCITRFTPSGVRCIRRTSSRGPAGCKGSPLHDLIAFHTVFGKTVPDVSLNAVANLGYAEGRFLRPVWSGDTLSAASEVIGLKENSNGRTGVVWVRTTGRNQRDEAVLEYVRWVMVRKRDAGARRLRRWCRIWRRRWVRSGW